MSQSESEAAGVQAEGALSRPRTRTGRRRLLKGTAAVAGGLTLAAYTRPTLQCLGPAVALAVSGPTAPVQGSPGFWKDGGKGQTSIWDTIGDIDWTSWAQKLGLTSATATNPFVKTDLFTSVFVTHPNLVGLTMQEVIDAPEQSTDAQKAARALVAAYLDAALYGPSYAYTQVQLKSMWEQAVTDNTPDAFDALKRQLEATYN